MSTENTPDVAPVAETQNTAPVPTEQPEIVEPDGTDSPAPEGDESEAKPEKSAEQRRIEELEARERALRRQLTKRDRTQGKLYQEAQTYKQQLEQYATREGGVADQRPVDPHEIADAIVKLKEVNELSNAVHKAGVSKNPDFMDTFSRVADEVGALFDERGVFTEVGKALIGEADSPAAAVALIEFLGAHPDIAAELEGMSPTKLGRRIERIEAQMKTTPVKPMSRASEPISPIKGGGGNVVKTLESMSPSEYAAHRAKTGAKWAR